MSTDTPVIDPADLAVRGIQLGRYTLLRRLAVGGMAELFLAEARGVEGFAKVVALKRILPQFAANHEFVKMFLHEARLVARLDHPNIAQVYDIGQSGQSYFFTMEYVHGEDLRSLLNYAYRVGRGLPLEHAVAVGIGGAAGLHHAHAQVDDHGRLRRIVHRDVTPSNIRVSYNGHVKLLDFGVAKAETSGITTNRDQVKGSVSYMSPEQCRGDDIDRRSDIFAMGILLYEATTSSRLFKGDDEASVMRQIESCRFEPPSARRPDYPPELERIVMKALQRDRELRHDSAQDLQLELEAFARHEGLVISTVALASYMERLFGAKIHAWQEAQKRGQSFGAHLAGTVEIKVEELAFLDDEHVIEESVAVDPGTATTATTADTPSSKGKRASLRVRLRKHRALAAVIAVCLLIGVGIGVSRMRGDDAVASNVDPDPTPHVRAAIEPPTAAPVKPKDEPPTKEPVIAEPKRRSPNGKCGLEDKLPSGGWPAFCDVPASTVSEATPGSDLKKPQVKVKKEPAKAAPSSQCPPARRLPSGKCASSETTPW